jgi:hypothetical protein
MNASCFSKAHNNYQHCHASKISCMGTYTKELAHCASPAAQCVGQGAQNLQNCLNQHPGETGMCTAYALAQGVSCGVNNSQF